MNLLEIRSFVIPVAIATGCLDAIKRAGQDGDELFIAWSGVREGERFTFRHAAAPRQQCHHTPDGLLVTIGGDALFELNRDANVRGEILAGQIHAHPDSAYHSPADDALAIITIPGGLSLVVPNFARAGLEGLSDWACFQMQASGVWQPVPNEVKVVIE